MFFYLLVFFRVFVFKGLVMNFNRIDLNFFVVFDVIYMVGSLIKVVDVLCII